MLSVVLSLFLICCRFCGALSEICNSGMGKITPRFGFRQCVVFGIISFLLELELLLCCFLCCFDGCERALSIMIVGAKVTSLGTRCAGVVYRWCSGAGPDRLSRSIANTEFSISMDNQKLLPSFASQQICLVKSEEVALS